MDKKREFNDALSELVQFATVSGNRLTKDQIHMYFKEIIEDESKYESVYQYLTELKIDIEGYGQQKQSSKKEETEEAKKFHSMYLEDMKAIDKDSADKKHLLTALLNGDKAAMSRITELYLEDVLKIASEYESSPLNNSDLVAEGNLALFEAALSYDGNDTVEQFEIYIEDKIRKAMEKAVFEELGSDRTSNHLAERLNALNDASTEMAKELGREASLEELAEKLSLSEEEIKELMKISIDVLTVTESE